MTHQVIQFRDAAIIRSLLFVFGACVLLANSGCGEAELENQADEKASTAPPVAKITPAPKALVANQTEDSDRTPGKRAPAKDEAKQPDVANPTPQVANVKKATPQAAVLAALADAQARLKKSDLYGFIERYLPLEQYVQIRLSKDHLKHFAMELAGNPLRMNQLIDALGKAQKGTVEFSKDGSIATVKFAQPKGVPEPLPPSNVIKAPVLTNAELQGWGTDLPKVVSAAISALNDGDTKAFVANMFPASELRHPDATARLASLEAKLKSQPAMLAQMKTDFSLLADVEPSIEDDGNTAVFEIAGQDTEIGRTKYKVKLPNRTFKFQLVEGSWRLYDHSTAVHAAIEKQSALAPPDLSGDAIPGEYVQLERLGDRWRILKIKTDKMRFSGRR